MVKVAADMTSKLEEYEQMLSEDLELAKMVPFRVTSRDANKRARVTKALQSNICEDTVAVLDDNHQRWMQDPSAFWTGPLSSSVNSADPHVQIVARSHKTNPDNE
jgi:hypothetical protein